MEFLTWLILGFASYRITRFLVIDSFFEGSREKFYVFLANRRGKLQFFWEKLLYLTGCTWCVGVYISTLSYIAWDQDWYGARAILTVAAIAGVQGMIHALEPSED